jgi:hypothetical protein
MSITSGTIAAYSTCLASAQYTHTAVVGVSVALHSIANAIPWL